MKRTIHLIVPVLALLMLTPGLFAQENAQTDGEAQPNASGEPAQPAETAGGGGGLGFGMGLTFGVSSFENPDTGEVETYQLLALRPEFVLGNFGLGLDLPVNYRFTGGDNGDEFEVREADWVPDSDTSFLELYLPKFRYIRYGQKGDDVYARFGGIPGATIGNGFLVNGYSNELYLPDRRIFGAVFDLDSALAGVKYFGFETMVSNVAAFDVMAGRFYVRPLAGTGLPLLPNLQVGVTVAADRNPYYFAERDPDSVYYDTSTPNDTALMWGLDVRQPILSGDVLSLAAFGDVAFQEDRVGTMVGAGGRAAGFLLYGAQIRVTQDNFIPGYFDNTYDRRRLERLAIFNGDTSVAGGASWLAQLGFSALGDGIVFNTSLTGPFTTSPDVYPELRSTLTVAEGIVPGFSGLSAEASYTKFDIREYNDLVSAENAMIGAQINIRSGPVVISLLYDLTYDPQASGGDQWTVTSGLESTISF